MPVWNPGSYILREFSRHVIDPVATSSSGRPIPLQKIAKNRIRVTTEGAPVVRLRYQVFANELSVRTNFVEERYAMLNPAGCFFEDVEAERSSIEVVVHRPEDWAVTMTSLKPASSGIDAPDVFVAPDFQALVDAPLLVGNPRVDRLNIWGVPHELVYIGDLRWFPFERAARDVSALVETQAAFWGHIPYSSYRFLNVLDAGRGGLEHADSTLIMMPPDAALEPAGYRHWLSLVSHELFHAWNGKRLRPEGLGPYDLEGEVYTRSLWFVEGMTSYYDKLLLRRAGLYDDAHYLFGLSTAINQLMSTPGERVQSLSRSSLDAWIEYYRRDAATANTSVSYYVKGALVGWVLDGFIRRQSGDKKSLDDVLRAAYATYADDTGYSDEAIYRVFETVGGPSTRALAETLTKVPGRLDLSSGLSDFGLRLQQASTEKAAWLGIDLEAVDGRWRVRSVVEDGPGWVAGLAPGDELLGIGGDRVPSEGVAPLIARYAPGEAVELLIARRGRLVSFEGTLGRGPKKAVLELDPKAAPDVLQRRAGWLGGRSGRRSR